MHAILSMIYNLVCNNHIHGWIRTTSHDLIPKGSKISNMTILCVCEWNASRSWQVYRCMQCIYLYFYTPFERVTGWPGISVSSEFQLFVGLCVVLHLKTASAPYRKHMWVLWFAILADLQRLLQPLCRIYSTFASRTFNLELAFEQHLPLCFIALPRQMGKRSCFSKHTDFWRLETPQTSKSQLN